MILTNPSVTKSAAFPRHKYNPVLSNNRNTLWTYFSIALIAHCIILACLYPYLKHQDLMAGISHTSIETYFYTHTSNNTSGNQTQQTNSNTPTLKTHQTKKGAANITSTTQTTSKQAAAKDKHTLGHSKLLELLHNRIQQYQTYPQTALFENESGTAKVGFQLLPSGKLTDIKLIQSSGYQDLDQAALQAVAAASPIDPLSTSGADWFTVAVAWHEK